MAVGDIINDVHTVGTTLSFQPAAGVEIMITSYGGWSNGYVGLYNGTSIGRMSGGMEVNSAGGGGATGANIKIGITNTNYLYIANMGGGWSGSYSGIQIK